MPSRTAPWTPPARATAMQQGMAVAAMLVPIVLFYALAIRTFSRLPFLDDYGILAYLVQWKEQPSASSKWYFVFTAQHAEYKIWFMHTVQALQVLLTGHVDFGVLACMGDCFVLVMLFALWLLWRNDARPGGINPLWFAPVAWIVFQLQYASTVNWAYGSMQYFPTIAFALLAFALCARPERWAFALALMCQVLAAGACGNGLLVIPVGILQLWVAGARRRAAAWAAMGAVVVAAYFYHYSTHQSQANHGGSIFEAVRHLSPAYALCFLGAAGTSQRLAPAFCVGLVFLALFAWATYDKLYRTAPALYFSMVLFMLTAVGVAGVRAELGLVQSLASRYRMYSAVMAAMLYLFVARKLAVRWKPGVRAYTAVTVCSVLLIGFTIGSDRAGYHLLTERRGELQAAMLRYQQGLPKSSFSAAEAKSEDPILRRRYLGLYEPDRRLLARAKQLGIYTAPNVLPVQP